MGPGNQIIEHGCTPMATQQHKVSLQDKYALESTRALMTGIEALARLPILQHQRDTAAGLNTAGAYIASINQNADTGTIRIWGDYSLSATTMTLDYAPPIHGAYVARDL